MPPPPGQKPPPPVERKSAKEAMQEAAARPLDFDPTQRSEFLKASIETVMSMKMGGRSEADIREENKELVERYPELFKTLMSSDDLTPLVAMIGMLDKIGTGEVSHHGASVVVGKALAERFLPKNIR